MSSAENVVQELMMRLPLAVLAIEWNDPSLVLSGAGWSISIMAPWRIVSGDQLRLGSDDATQRALEEAVQDKIVIACEMQSRHSRIDPALIFDGGLVLEVFSASHLEPWTLSLAGAGMFVASPSD